MLDLNINEHHSLNIHMAIQECKPQCPYVPHYCAVMGKRNITLIGDFMVDSMSLGGGQVWTWSSNAEEVLKPYTF